MRREENQIVAEHARPHEGDQLQRSAADAFTKGPSHDPNARLGDDARACPSRSETPSTRARRRTNDQVVLDRLPVLLRDGLGASQQGLVLVGLVGLGAVHGVVDGRRHGVDWVDGGNRG